MMQLKTTPDVFIIESLRDEDEERSRYEGYRLAELLRLSGKKPKYFYFKSKEELSVLFKLFKLSNYRYLHISCHGTAFDIEVGESKISYNDFSELSSGYLERKRVFFSACELGNELFSTCLAGRNKGMHSIVAPAEEINFDHAAAIWSAFYVSVFARKKNSMKSQDILARIQSLCTLFPVDFHVSLYRSQKDNWEHIKVNKKKLSLQHGNKKPKKSALDINSSDTVYVK